MDFAEMVAKFGPGVQAVTMTSLRIGVIILLAWVAVFLLRRTIRGIRVSVSARMGENRESVKRAETLGRVFRHLATVVVSLVCTMLVLGELGISVAPILGAAGVVGLAVGFGAQSLVKDYFTGFFLLLEDQIRQGDVVRLNADHSGLVEVMTLRHVQLRDYDGNVHFVPNSQISTVVNMSRGFAHAVIDIGVAYRENVDEVMKVMREVASVLREDAAFSERILDQLDMAGVERLGDSAVVLRCRFKVKPLEQWSVRREYLRRLKAAFDEHGIEIPYPHLTVYPGQDKRGQTPEFAMQLSRQAASASSP